MTDTPSIVPYLSYSDAKAACTFLEQAVGLSLVTAFDAEDGALLHAEMAHGNGVVMIGTEERPKGSPGIYLVVADVDAHFERASSGGAKIVYPPEDTEWGTRRYRACDLEGHEWTFGTYQPQTTAPVWT